MTLRIIAPNPMRLGETGNVVVACEHPCVVSLTYGAGLTGPATVTIEGTRVWGANNQMNDDGFNVPAAGAHAIRMRDNCTIGFFIDTAMVQDSPLFIGPEKHLASNYSSYRRINWHFDLRRITFTQVTLNYTQSDTAGTNESTVTFAKRLTYGSKHLVIVTFSGTTLTRYLNNNTPEDTLTRTAPTGVDNNPYCRISSAGKFYYWDSVLSSDDIALWMAGSATTAAPIVAYALDEEGTAKAYDLSANAYDGVFDLDAAYPASQIVRTFTDSAPVVPYAIVPVTAVATTGTTIDATRPRQGVPARASEAEKTETADQCTVTVEAPLVSIGPDTDVTVEAYPADVHLQVCATPDGVVSLASDDPNLTVPETVEVSGGSATVTCTASADVSGATITATYGATTDEAVVSVTEAPEPEELLAIGPDVVAEVESYPDAIILLLTSNIDGDVEIVSDNENLIPMSPVTVIDGKAEVACLVTADVSGVTITASRDPGPSDSCSVSVSDVLAGDWIAVGPNQRTRIEGKRIVWPIRVRSSKDGAFTATADPATGIIIAGPFELVDGACDITAQPTQAGTWTLTVEQDGRTDSVTLQALAAAALPVVKQYNLSAEIDAFFDFINRKYGFRPRFTPANVQDVRAEHATDRTYSRYAQGTGQPGSVFGAVALSYQVMISYSSVTMAEQDLGILREEADRYNWNAIGFSMTGQTMFEPVKMMPRLTLTLNFDIIPQGR